MLETLKKELCLPFWYGALGVIVLCLKIHHEKSAYIIIVAEQNWWTGM